MSVYYVHSPEVGRTKIGFARDPWTRLSKMQADNPTRLVLLAVEDGDQSVERARHIEFAALRERGEWFRHEGALVAHIQALPRFAKPRRKAVAGPLGAWLADNGHTLGSFAAIVGTTQATMSRVAAGKHFPRSPLLFKIIKATRGEIDANALLQADKAA